MHHSLAPLLLLALGVLWLVWLARLRAQPDAPARKRCHQVDPRLRSALLVFAVLLLLSCLWCIGQVCVQGMPQGSCVFVCLYVVFVALFALQLVWLRRVSRCKRRVRDGYYTDDPWSKAHAAALVGTAVLFIGAGAVGVWRWCRLGTSEKAVLWA